MSSKSKAKPMRQPTFSKAVSHALLIFLWAFCTEFSPEWESLERLNEQIRSVRESIMCGSLTIDGIRDALRTEYGLYT